MTEGPARLLSFMLRIPCGPAMLSRRKLSGDRMQKFFFLKILSGFASDLAKKSGDPPRRVSGGSPDNFRRGNIAGPHGKYAIQRFDKKNDSEKKSCKPTVCFSTFFQFCICRGSPDSSNFGPTGDRTIAKIILSGDSFSTKIGIWDF